MPPLDTRHGGQVIVAPPPAGRVATPASLHAVFEHTVAEHPDAVAIEVPPSAARPERRRFTYAQIDALAARLAARLAPRVARDSVIALSLPRDSHLIYVAQLAVLKAGAAYTCIEPGFLPDRARFVLEDSRAVAVVTSADLRSRVAALGVADDRIVEIDSEEPANGVNGAPSPATHGHAPRAPRITGPDSLAYVIYTSGTSGQPKGVMIEHRNVVNLVLSPIAATSTSGPATASPRVRRAPTTPRSRRSGWRSASGATLVVMDDEARAARTGPGAVAASASASRCSARRPRCCAWRPATTRRASCRTCACSTWAARNCRRTWRRAGRPAAGSRTATARPSARSPSCARPSRAGEPVTIGWPVEGNRAWVLDEDAARRSRPARPASCASAAPAWRAAT